MRIIHNYWSITPQPSLGLAAVLPLLLLGGSASAQTDNPHRHRFGISYRPGFNITAKFRDQQGSGGSGTRVNPGAPVAGADHTYADGYNRVDITGNNHGGVPGTWNWGYDDPSQIQGNTIAFHAVTSSGDRNPEADGDPQHGMELTYNGRLGQWGRVPWGIEAACSFTDLTIRAKARGTETQITDLYDLGGVVPPAPVYRGTFEGPVPGGPNAPVIGDVPLRTQESSAVASRRDVDATVWGLRLGPYVDIPLDRRWMFTFSGGLALAWMDSDFQYHDTVTPTAGPSLVTGGSNSHSDWLVGGFLAGKVSYAMTESLHLFGGVQYQGLGDFSQKAGGKRAEIELGQSIFVTVGCGFSF